MAEEKRLGRIREGKRPEYPELDVNGKPYDRNGVSTMALDQGHFVVLPRFGAVSETALADLRAKLASATKAVEEAPKAARS